MEETKSGNNDRDTPPKNEGYPWSKFLIDLGTLIILTFTMIGVFWYACIASRQNTNLVRSVNEEIMVNRPVLIANGVVAVQRSNNVPSRIAVVVINFGKTAAPSATAVGHLFIVEPGQPAPVDPRCSKSGKWPTDAPYSALVPGPGTKEAPELGAWVWEPAQGQDVTLVNAGKILFVVGCIYYKGLDGNVWFSDVCVSWAGGDSFRSCSDHNRNYVD